MLLEVPHFATSVYKSAKHFGLRFAYDAPKIWNDLPDNGNQSLLATHLEEAQNLSLCKSIPTLTAAFSLSFSMALTPAG